MKTYTLVMYYMDGRVETAKNKEGALITIDEGELDFLSLNYSKGKLHKVVAVCNETPQVVWVELT